jgi:hypothetical protein
MATNTVEDILTFYDYLEIKKKVIMKNNFFLKVKKIIENLLKCALKKW